jgi:glycosyltransferase involved in cell wall biosynthesis
MKLNIIDDNKEVNISDDEFSFGDIETNELNQNANGGTEMMQRQLAARLDPELLSKFQIIASRVRKMDPTKKKIYWVHDLFGDPEVQHLRDGGWDNFDKIVYVSYWQKATYELAHGIPPSKGVVMQNAIEPFAEHEKPKDVINLIYHTTPHRGLELLYPVYEAISEEFGDKVHLDVYSSFNAYGWPQRDEPYEELFQKLKDHPHITYHGYQPNEVVREALTKAHIFAYPSIWQETSCIAAIEALAAGCLTITSTLGALPETCANWAWLYANDEDANRNANMFYGSLRTAITAYWQEDVQVSLYNQAAYFNLFYNWSYRANQWAGLLKGLSASEVK